MATNPYATPPPRPGRAPAPAQGLWAGNSRYAVPDVPETTDPEYTLGFSPTLKAGGSPDGSQLPDDIRVGTRKSPVGNNYNEPKWVAHRQAEKRVREESDHTEVMWSVKQERIPPPNMPLWNQDRPPTRPTATNSPTGYAFQRDWHIPRNITDALSPDAVTHFSMADHRRNYEIMTMKPQGRVGVNSYRVSPRPWDENLFVAPQDNAPRSSIATGSRAYRLG